LKKSTIDKNELTKCIETLQKQYPPPTEKNIKMAFKVFLDKGYDEIIVYTQWSNIYKPNKVAEEIAEEILKAPKIRRSGINDFIK
jgi:hypothetical protein